MGLKQIRGKLIKNPGMTKVTVVNNSQYLRELYDLEPGTYEFIIQPVESRLKQMKKHYFALESELALHLGYKKVKLHEQLKEFVGHYVDENGNRKYLSISKITSEDEMMQRILELAEFAAKELDYVFKPYNPPANEIPGSQRKP